MSVQWIRVQKKCRCDGEKDYCVCGGRGWYWVARLIEADPVNAAGQSCECNGEPHAPGCPLHSNAPEAVTP